MKEKCESILQQMAAMNKETEKVVTIIEWKINKFE